MKKYVFLLQFVCLALANTFAQAKPFTQKLDSCMIILSTPEIGKTMQGFDILKTDSIYLAWEEKHYMHVRRVGSGDADMILPTGGHGDCFTIDHRDTDQCNFWACGSLGEPMSNGGFMGGQSVDPSPKLICKYRYEPGAIKYPEDALECYYLNNNGCRFVDVDERNNIFLCWTYIGDQDYFVIFKLSDLATCQKRNMRVERNYNQGMEFEVSDLNSINPITSFPWDRMVACGRKGNYPKAVQGLCVSNGKIYVLSGYKDDVASTVSILDFEGNILETCAPVKVSEDKILLKQLGLSDNGNFEPEGIHFYKDSIIMGFVGEFQTTDITKRSNIIKIPSIQ